MPDGVVCLGKIEEDKDREFSTVSCWGALETIFDCLCDSQDLIFTAAPLSEACLHIAEPATGFGVEIQSLSNETLKEFDNARGEADRAK